MKDRDTVEKGGGASLLNVKEEFKTRRPSPWVPELSFFRHLPGISGVKPGQKFGSRYLYKWWKIACDNLKIEGVDLYGST